MVKIGVWLLEWFGYMVVVLIDFVVVCDWFVNSLDEFDFVIMDYLMLWVMGLDLLKVVWVVWLELLMILVVGFGG